MFPPKEGTCRGATLSKFNFLYLGWFHCLFDTGTRNTGLQESWVPGILGCFEYFRTAILGFWNTLIYQIITVYISLLYIYHKFGLYNMLFYIHTCKHYLTQLLYIYLLILYLHFYSDCCLIYSFTFTCILTL